MGQGAPARHDRQPAGLDALAPAPVGRADAVLHPQGDRRAASAHARSCSKRSRKRVEQGGIEAWQRVDPRELLGADARQYEKIKDTLDVWFDSGSTHHTVLRGSHDATQSQLPGRPVSRRLGPASRLVPFVAAVSCMLNGVPPYKALLTHGFVVDGEGRKMSKSLGNVDRAAEGLGHAGRGDPAPVGGGDRLLRRAVDLRRDPEARGRELSPHPQHAALPARQHLRFRSGEARACRWPRWLEIDRYALALTRAAAEGRACTADYDALRVPPGGAEAADVLLRGSGRLLPRHPEGPALHRGADSRARRSAQTALYHITHSLLRLMAPILSFTAEEGGRSSPAKSDDSVFFHTWTSCRCRPTRRR